MLSATLLPEPDSPLTTTRRIIAIRLRPAGPGATSAAW